MKIFPYQRIVVIGVTGSGKSTLAENLSNRFDIPYIELDAFYWEPGWREADPTDFLQRVESAVDKGTWIVAGNYSRARFITWTRAEAVIWLDYPLPVVFWRLLKRTLRRSLTRERLWNDNREVFWRHLKFWSEDSLFHWFFKTYWRRKKETPILLSMPEHKHLKVMHFTRPHETDEWLNSLNGSFAQPGNELG